MVEVAAHDLRLLLEPARADAEEEAPAAEEVEGGHFLGEQQRVPLGDQDDPGPELDAARSPRGARERDERVDEVRVALRDHAVLRAREATGRLHRDERMLGAPERLEAELFGLPGHEADVDEVRGQGNRDADVHRGASFTR